MKLKLIVATVALLVLQASAARAQIRLVTASGSANDASWVAGVHAGYNWQNGALVYGLETDLSGTGLHSQTNSTLTNPPGTASGSTTSNIDWYGTFRGRIGWTSGPVLIYGTGGVAYGTADLSSSLGDQFGNSIGAQDSARLGWVGGGGINYMWSPNLIINFNYQYVDLGRVSVTAAQTGPFLIESLSASAHAQFQVVTIGFSWRFPPAGNASQGAWTGAYIGGQVGGAWGNDVSASYTYAPPETN